MHPNVSRRWRVMDRVVAVMVFYLAFHGGLNLTRPVPLSISAAAASLTGLAVLGLVWWDRRRSAGPTPRTAHR